MHDKRLHFSRGILEFGCAVTFDSARYFVLDTFLLLDVRIMPWIPQP